MTEVKCRECPIIEYCIHDGFRVDCVSKSITALFSPQSDYNVSLVENCPAVTEEWRGSDHVCHHALETE